MSVDWSETKLILHEVEQLFNRDDDIKDIFDVKKMHKEIESYCANSVRDAKDLIKEMTNHVTAKEAEVLAPTDAMHADDIQKLMIIKEAINKEIENLRTIIDQKRNDIFDVASKSLSYKEKMSELAKSNQISDARTAYAL